MPITENSKKNNRTKTIQKIFSVFLAVYPLLCIYKAFFRFTIGDVLLMAFLALGLMRPQKIDFRVLSIGSFVAYTVFVFVLNLIFFKTMQLAAVLPYTLRLVKLIFYLLSAIIGGRAFFNTKYFEKALFTTSVVVCVFLFFQYIMYYGAGTVVLGRIPGLTVYLQEYLELDYETIYSYSFRPSSLFLEPANFCQFMVVPLGLALFSKNTTGKKRIFYIIIFTLGMLLSTSAQGMLYLAVVYIAYFLRGTTKKSMAAVFITIAIIAALIMYSEVDVVKTAVDRLFNENAVDARFGSYSYLKTMEGIHIVLGYGYGVVPEEEFLAGAAYIIYGCGMFGFAFACLMFYELYKRATGNKAKTVCFIFFVALFGTSIFYNYMLFWYISIILCVKDGEKSYSSYTNFSRNKNTSYTEERLLQPIAGEEIPIYETDDFIVERNREKYRQNKVFSDFDRVEGTQKNILFILGMYHPQYSANGVSCKKVIDECIREGYSVSCVVNDYAGEKKEDVIDGANVYRIKHRLYDRVIQWCGRNTDKAYVGLVRKFAFVANKLKLIITSPTWPIVSPLYSYRFYKKAKELVEKEEFDAIVSIYTPVDALLGGYFIKKKFPEIKYIQYFLDSLSGGYGPKQFSKERTIKRGLRIESKVFEEADKIVLMKSSEEHQMKYNSRFCDKFIFLDIPMLSEPEEIIEESNQDATVKLLFVGSLSANVRNPETLITALENIGNDNISCEFVGNITCKDKFNNLKKLYGDRLILTDFINHDDLLEKIAQADILINVGNLISTMVPSKIFEYMSYGKPIISTFDIENEPSKKYLEKYPLALLLSKNDCAGDNAQKIQEFIKDTAKKRVVFEEVENVFRLNTPKAFIDNVLRNGLND